MDLLRAFLVVLLTCSSILAADEPKRKKIIFLAGAKDANHPAGTHEYEKACRVLKYALDTSSLSKAIVTELYLNGWPDDPKTLDTADTLVLISSGADRNPKDHPFLVDDRMKILEKQMKRGCGLVLIHWSVFVPKDTAGESILEWVGGYFDYESGPKPRGWYSKIQTYKAKAIPASPNHPLCRGLAPFEVQEEFYYNMRFRERDPRLIPVISTKVPNEKEEQIVGWAVQRHDTGRGFGFTGGHFFQNWQNDNFRKSILNAIVWTAKIDIPQEGVSSKFPSDKELAAIRVGKPIETLILTGHDGPFHNWKETSKALRDVLAEDPRFQIRTVEDPSFLEKSDLLAYDLIVQNYVNWERPGLSEKAKANLLRFLESGKGLAVIHFANGAFHHSLPKASESDWPEYRKIVRRVWDHTDKNCGHDAYGPFQVEITSLKHPITEGMASFDTIDELYYQQSGNEPIQPLITAKSKVTGKQEPLAWASNYKQGRVFQTLLGHAAESIRKAGPAQLIRRGATWAANREQINIQTEENTFTLVPGKFGKALDASKGAILQPGLDRFRKFPLTVECWVKLKNKDAFNVFVSHDPKESSQHWEIYSYAGSGNFSAYFPGTVQGEIQSKVNIADDLWHYVAMTCDGKQVQLFVDGKQVHQQAIQWKKGVKPVLGSFCIGQAISGDHRIGCDAWIDEVRISNVVRAITETPRSEFTEDPQTIGLWRLDQESGLKGDPAWTPPPSFDYKSEAWERHTDKDWMDGRFRKMDTGPFFNATMEYPTWTGRQKSYKATAIRLGDSAAVMFDRNQLRFTAGWTGNYLIHSDRRFGLLNTPTPAGTVLFSTSSQPGSADPEGQWACKHPATAPLPKEWAKYRGLYLHKDRTVLHYTIGDVEVLESPKIHTQEPWTIFTRVIEVGPSKYPVQILAGELPDNKQIYVVGEKNKILAATKNNVWSAVAVTGAEAELGVIHQNQLKVTLPASKERRRLQIHLASATAKDANGLEPILKNLPEAEDLRELTKPGQARWTKPIITKGEVSTEKKPYVMDTITFPYDNPYNALFFVTGLDFLPNGDVAICTCHGDVWIVQGVDAKLEKLTWRRFATGLYHPLGLKVVDGKIIVLERGQLTRLHDNNNDYEADYYENINNDWHTGPGEHSYDTCLEVDPQGNFFFFKTGDDQTPTGGCLMKVFADGSKSEIYSTGFRHPIGLGMSPKGMVTGADQEGNWMPATRIDVYRKGGFYGDMRTHHRTEPPKTYDPPLLWLPRDVDNSAGGQVWVPEGKFGPLSGQMLHLSYGRCKIYLILPQFENSEFQAGATDLGLVCLSGICRGRFHPQDGHLYVAGLNGWQTAARKDGCLQRIRYTGEPVAIPIQLTVNKEGIRLNFTEKLEKTQAESLAKYRVEQWNYRWSSDYGSRHWSLLKPNREGHDVVTIESAKLSEDGKSVILKISNLQPVMQMKIEYDLQTHTGQPLQGRIHNTIHFVR